MKVTYKQLIESVPAFQELIELKFNPKVAEELAELTASLDLELDKFDGKIDELTKNIEDVNLRTEEINKLLNSPIEIDVPQYSSDLITQQVSPQLFKGLSWLLRKEKSLLKTKPLKVL